MKLKKHAHHFVRHSWKGTAVCEACGLLISARYVPLYVDKAHATADMGAEFDRTKQAMKE